jgi:hypothetical protein
VSDPEEIGSDFIGVHWIAIERPNLVSNQPPIAL